MQIVYSINETRTWKYFFRLIFILWTIFGIYMFNMNPYFFGITVFVSILLIPMTFNHLQMVLTDKEIFIRDIRVFRPNKVIKKIQLIEIQDCKHEENKPDGSTWILNLLEYVPGTLTKDKYFKIKLKDNSIIDIDISSFGTETETAEMLQRMKNSL